MFVGWVTNGKVTLLDTYAPQPSIPNYDKVQNLKVISGALNNGWTTITFSRLASTGDTAQDVVC